MLASSLVVKKLVGPALSILILPDHRAATLSAELSP